MPWVAAWILLVCPTPAAGHAAFRDFRPSGHTRKKGFAPKIGMGMDVGLGLGLREKFKNSLSNTVSIANKTVDYDMLFDPASAHQGLLSDYCHTTFSGQDIEARNFDCPDACPFVAQVFSRDAGQACQFKCVRKKECGTGVLDPEDEVADEELLVCRRCKVPGCHECHRGKKDFCWKKGCNFGYGFVRSSGQCVPKSQWIFNAILLVLGAIILGIVFWVLDLGLFRPVVNSKGLGEGVQHREQTKLKHVPKDDPGSRLDHPFFTNFHRMKNSHIAGPGMVLYFNFMLFCFVWPITVAIAWYALGASNSGNLFLNLGLEPEKTVLQRCGINHQGRIWNHEFQPIKQIFLFRVYIGSFAACILFGVYQQLCFNRMQDKAFMHNYMGKLNGLRSRLGSEHAEQDLRKFVEDACGEDVVGVSVAWNYSEESDAIAEMIEADLKTLERENQKVVYLPKAGASHLTEEEIETIMGRMNGLHKWMAGVERTILEGYVGEDVEKKWSDHTEIEKILRGLRSSEHAFVVFHTEEARDRAVRKCQAEGGWVEPGGEQGDKRRVQMIATRMQPDTILWANFYDNESKVRFSRVCECSFYVVFMQVMWGLCFYFPYVYYVAAFAYANGNEPDGMVAFLFSMIVVVGNQVNYFVCGATAEYIGFAFSDRTNAWYCVSYCAASIINVAVDMVLTYILSMKMMNGLNIRIEDGRLFDELTSSTQILDTFPMQRTLGDQLWLYNWPATFGIPYWIEPFATVAGPFLIFKFLVRACPVIVGRKAEIAMSVFGPMDLGRYADIVVNLFLCAASFFLVQGHYLFTWAFAAGSNIYLYFWDAYKVLRCVNEFDVASDYVDLWGQALLGLVCSTLLAAYLWKENCKPFPDEARFCMDGPGWWTLVGFAFWAHFVVHFVLVFFVLPGACKRKPKPNEEPFESWARIQRKSVFTTNPVHCLRSRFIYKHDPPAIFAHEGKAHLHRANPSIGCYYEETHHSLK